MSRKGFGKVKRKVSLGTVQNSSISSDNYQAVPSSNEVKGESVVDTPAAPKEGILSNVLKWVNEVGSNSNTSDSKEEPNKEKEVVEEVVEEKKIEIIENNDPIIEIEDNKYFTEEKTMNTRVTTIAEDVEITGDIKMSGDLEFYGKVVGDIKSTGDVNVSNAAKIEGKLYGRNLTITHGNVNGDVTIISDARIEEQSTIIGDVHAETLVSSGVIIGNVFINDKVILNQTSKIEGNIKARELEVRSGAIIQGQIDIETK